MFFYFLFCSSIFFSFHVFWNDINMLCKITHAMIHRIMYSYWNSVHKNKRKFVKLIYRFLKMSNACSISMRMLNNFLLKRLFFFYFRLQFFVKRNNVNDVEICVIDQKIFSMIEIFFKSYIKICCKSNSNVMLKIKSINEHVNNFFFEIANDTQIHDISFFLLKNIFSLYIFFDLITKKTSMSFILFIQSINFAR